MAGALEGDLFIGPKAKEHRGLLNIKYPIEHGIVTDWNDMEQIWTVRNIVEMFPLLETICYFSTFILRKH